MKTYELLIAEHQPKCGGKSPVRTTIQMVTINDPVAYVKEREPNNELNVSTEKDGTIVVETDHNGFAVRYEFTED